MSVSDSRKQTLIFTLASRNDFVTADTLAETLNVSKKTIYRLVNQINEESNNPTYIISQRGRGYRLNDRVNNISKVARTHEGASPVERRNIVMKQLLLSSPKGINVMDLYEPFYLGENTIVVDEKIMSNILSKYGLDMVRKDRELKVIGEERPLRQAINDLTISPYAELEVNISQNKDLDKSVSKFVQRQIAIIEKSLNISIPHPYNINIFSHIYILIDRVQKVGKASASQLAELTSDDLEKMSQEAEIETVSKAVIKNVEKYLNTQLPVQESYYLFQYIISSRLQGRENPQSLNDQKTIDITRFLVEQMGLRLNLKISHDSKLYLNLYQHIKPMLNRLENQITIKNGLLEQIKIEYSDIYLQVIEACQELSKAFDLDVINEDEIGYLALYFAQYIEGNPGKVHVLIMCTTGIGTSELLRVKIQKLYPNIDIVDVIASRELNESILEHYNVDLIVSTIEAPNKLNIPFIVVSAMLSANDQARLEKVVHQFD